MPTSQDYSPEFQLKAVNEVAKGDRSVPEIAREFGVSASTLRDWVMAVEERKIAALKEEEEAAITELRREVETLRKEVEELRKDRELVDSLEKFFAERLGRST